MSCVFLSFFCHYVLIIQLWIYCLLNTNLMWFLSLDWLPRTPSILLTKEGWWLKFEALWRSKPVLLFHVGLNASHVMMGPGLDYTYDLPLFWAWLLPSRIWIQVWATATWLEDTWSWAQHMQPWWEVRFGSHKSQKEICLLLNAKPGSTTAWGYFSICFFLFQS